MKLNAISYFAGIGTVVGALAVGFCGALLIAGPHQETGYRNRVQQVMSQAPSSSTMEVAKVEKPLQTEITKSSQPVPPDEHPALVPTVMTAKQVEAPATAKPDAPQRAAAQETDTVNRAKLREPEVKHPFDRDNQRKWAERKRRQQEIEAATIAVKRMLQDRRIVQVDNSGPTRFGLFGEDN